MVERGEHHVHESSRSTWRRLLVIAALLALMLRRAYRRTRVPAPATPSGHKPETVNRYGHEAPHLAWRGVLVIGAVLALIVVIAVVGNYAALRVWLAPNHAEVMARPAPIPPEPRLQPHPRSDLAAYRAEMRRRLSTYAWVDSSHAYARIPIQRAMAIYAKRQGDQPATASTAGVPR